MYAFLDLKINDYILLNFILFIYLLFLTGPQGQQCYTLMGFSILYKNSLLLLLLLSRASQRSEGLGVLLPPGFCIQNGEYTNINWIKKKVGCIGMEAIGSTSRHFSSDI